MPKRHTISIGDEAYQKLRDEGKFGESYSQLILRLVRDYQTKVIAD